MIQARRIKPAGFFHAAENSTKLLAWCCLSLRSFHSPAVAVNFIVLSLRQVNLQIFCRKVRQLFAIRMKSGL